VITGLVGSASYMTWDQIQELYDNGWTLAAHSVDHTSLATLPIADAKKQVLDSKNSIEQNISGVEITRFVAPSGSWSVDLEVYARSLGFLETPYSINRNTISWDDSVDDILELLKKEIAIGSHVELYTHAILSESGSSYDIKTSVLEGVLENISSLGCYIIPSNGMVEYSESMDAATVIIDEFQNDSIKCTINDFNGKAIAITPIKDLAVLDTINNEMLDSELSSIGIIWNATSGHSYLIMDGQSLQTYLMGNSLTSILGIGIFVMVIVGVFAVVGGRR
jgi:hypothetical protein